MIGLLQLTSSFTFLLTLTLLGVQAAETSVHGRVLDPNGAPIASARIATLPAGPSAVSDQNGEFSLMVAFVEEGHITVGVVLEPAQNRLTYATAGGGCWRRDGADTEAVPCRVSAEARPTSGWHEYVR